MNCDFKMLNRIIAVQEPDVLKEFFGQRKDERNSYVGTQKLQIKFFNHLSSI